MAIEITARKREAQGTGASRRLRHMGLVPAILYGGDKEPVKLELDHQELILNLRNERFHASILTLDVAGAKEQVLLRTVNMHPFKLQVQHIDFQRVSKDKKIHMKVPLHFINAEKSPGVKEQAGVVSHVLNEIDISCFPADLPEFIEVDLGNLSVGNSVHARQLTLPKGVELALHKAEDPVVATVVVPQLVTEDEEKAAETVVAAGDVPTTEQAAPAKEGEAAAAEGDKGKGGDKAAAKPAADKGGEKKDKK
jgi:large subunit ribosomal protein L25